MAESITMQDLINGITKQMTADMEQKQKVNEMNQIQNQIVSEKDSWDYNQLKAHNPENCNCGLCQYKTSVYRDGVIQGAKLAVQNPNYNWSAVQ